MECRVLTLLIFSPDLDNPNKTDFGNKAGSTLASTWKGDLQGMPWHRGK